MTTATFFVVLASAVMHASWNLAIKASGDRLTTAGAQVALGALAFSPLLGLVGIPWTAFGWVALSSATHLLYGLSLVAAYERGDLSAVYPIARGVAPALIALGAAVLLGDSITTPGIVAITLIVVGIGAIGLAGRPRGISWALTTGLFITVYTLIDGHAVRGLDGSVAYTICVFVGNSALYLPVILWRRGLAATVTTIMGNWWRLLLGGIASAGAYALVLVAARTTPLGLVSAVRETSVVFGALAGWLLLGESFGPRRLVAAAAIGAGLVLVRL